MSEVPFLIRSRPKCLAAWVRPSLAKALPQLRVVVEPLHGGGKVIGGIGDEDVFFVDEAHTLMEIGQSRYHRATNGDSGSGQFSGCSHWVVADDSEFGLGRVSANNGAISRFHQATASAFGGWLKLPTNRKPVRCSKPGPSGTSA